MLYQTVNLVGSKHRKYQDSQMFGEAIGQQSLANALDHASIPAESVAVLAPDISTARSLLTQLHGDTFRQQRAWQNRKSIDQDPSRTLEIWETIREFDEMQEHYTVDIDSDYESDTEGQPSHTHAKLMVAPINRSATRAALRSTSKEKASTLVPPISPAETEPLASPTLEAGVQLKLPTRTEFISAQTAVPQWKALRVFKLHQTPSTDETIQTWIDRNDANYECDEDGLLWRLCLRDTAAKLEPVR